MSQKPKIEAVEPVFDGRAVLIRMSGEQTMEIATPMRKLVYWLSSKGKRHFIYDLREVSFPHQHLAELANQNIEASRVLPHFHVALWHDGQDPDAIRALLSANRRIGNQVVDVLSLDEARNWMFPGLVDLDAYDDDGFDLDSLERRSA
ncbi:hypothetical protein [Maricaulis parjimensis]|uniref:hypothetical protein n=1 Tax=Maricaulis parjimensis TaxID=144023 RepID=UPI00193AD4E6|nr:hypothetical protein [Maricaulis parjimensis]